MMLAKVRETLCGAGVALFLLSGCSKEELESDASGAASSGKTRLIISATGEVDEASLRQVRWQDVAATVQDCRARGCIDGVLGLVSEMDTAVSRYFAGALELTRGQAWLALEWWEPIEVSEIPPNYLYTPWKLSRELKPNEGNPFEAALAEAVSGRLVTPLVEARFSAQRTDYQLALEAYLRSDPAQWNNGDIENLYRCKEFAPLQGDASLLIAAVLSDDRLPDKVRGFAEEVGRLEVEDERAALKERLRLALQENPKLKETAVVVAKRQLDLRKAFAESRFGEVLQYGEVMDPRASNNEAVLLVYLAAMGERQTQLSSRWGAELRKRFPGKETLAWMESLTDS